LRVGIAGFVIVFQSVLFLAHWFVYWTWAAFRTTDPVTAMMLKAALGTLSSTFVVANLLAFRYYNALVRMFYRIAATWLGLFNFLFLAAGASWLVLLGVRLSGVPLGQPVIAGLLFSLAALAGLYGLLNARLVRVTEITVNLPNLPRSWRGRTAALVSDVHLGHINGAAFLRRVVAKIEQRNPDIIFITGDVFDGTTVNTEEIVSPLKQLSVRYGAYFVTGNHEEFSDPMKYIEAIKGAGVGVLDNQKIVLDGLQIVGVNDGDSAKPARFRSILAQADIDQNQASILLSHSPHALSVVEKAGVSLQLSGHTHGGQVFPFTWFARRIFGKHTYGLSRFGQLMIYTSSGAGTWGPPMRVGTCPEIVLIRFE
jgi:predicted MPP superfamily phosphohydrolase